MSASTVPSLGTDGSGAWIALPTYNERDNLEPLVGWLLALLPEIRILIIDDNSPDGTGHLADRLAEVDRRVEVLHRAGKEGLGAAYRAGFKHLLARADCDVIVQMDCDFSHDPADVPRLIGALHDADLVIGSRYIRGGDTPGWSLARRIISRGGNWFARAMLELPLHDMTGGFKAWRVGALRMVDMETVETQGYGFQIETTWRAHLAGAVIHEIPIVFSERRAGESKMSRRIAMEAFGMVLRLRRASRSSVGAGHLRGLALVDGTGRVAVDDLAAAAVPVADGPSGGGLTADRAAQPEAGD